MGGINDEYQDMLDKGIYEDEDELMREEGINYEDLYKEDEDEYDDSDDNY